MSDVVVLGDIVIDILARLESYPAIGGDAQSLETHVRLGGTTLNTAVMLARLGLKVAMIGCVGEDLFGDFAVQAMAASGLSTRWVQRDGRHTTALAYIAVTPDGQRTMLGGAGANRMLDGRDLHAPELRSARWLHMTSYNVMSPSAHAAALEACALFGERGVPVSIDIGMAPVRLRPAELADLVARCQIVMPSDVTPYDGLPRHLIVRKCGARGCEVIAPDGGEATAVPGFAARVVDTTGAGDAFDAGYIVGQLRGLDRPASALLANACGAAACTVTGAGNALPRASVVRELLGQCAPAGWHETARRVIDALSPWPD
ncbi:MAG: carbohydrate kinase family protein [Chloroflexi bacterium]|nr:carbohydrate kinase family protein [Chloroflexota bacterium]